MKISMLYLTALILGSQGKLPVDEQLKSVDRPYMNTYMSEDSLLLQRCNELSISAPPAEWPGSPFSALLDPFPVRTTANDRCNRMEDILQSYNGAKLPCWQRNDRDIIAMNGLVLGAMMAPLIKDLDDHGQWMELEKFMVAALNIQSHSEREKIGRCRTDIIKV